MSGFLSKLTGAEKEEENFDSSIDYNMDEIMDSSEVISLPIDAYEDEENIFIKTFIPSIDPKDINIDITRDTVTISGEKSENQDSMGQNFFQKELAWGNFQKKIMLPKEIDIDSVKASAKLGVLNIKLTKIDKDKKVKINVG